MPKFGIHNIVLDQIIAKYADDAAANNNQVSEKFARILNDNRFASNLGSIGPDLLFWAPDYAIAKNLDELVKTYDNIKEKIDIIRDFAEGIKDNIEEGIDEVMDVIETIPIIGPAISEIEELNEAIEKIKEEFEILSESLQNEIKTALLLKLIGLDSAEGSDSNTTARSIFQGIFQSSQQAGREEMEWYWFEMLHYRNTGDFTKKLIEIAEENEDEKQMAYAYAYVSHYATDLVGHPYVNTISGAPYRISVQRHVVIENYMDQWKWINSDGELNNNIRNELFTKLGFEEIINLPDNIATLIADALFKTYQDLIHPLRYVGSLRAGIPINPIRDGFLNAEDIKTAYRFQRNMLKFLGGQEEVIKPVEPFEGAGDALNGINLPPAPPLPNTGTPASVDEFFQNIDEWYAAMANYLDWASDVMGIIMDEIAQALQNFLDDPSEEIRKFIQSMAYGLELMIYDIYRWIHQILALSGLAYPEPDDVSITGNINNSMLTLSANPIAERLITTRNIVEMKYPILRMPGQPHLDTRSHIQFMEDQNNSEFVYGEYELPNTVVSYYHLETNKTPDVFINIVPLDVPLLTGYARAKTTGDTRNLQFQTPKSFGNAVDLSIFILNNKDDDALADVVFCNWNLDGDRGYGYKSWDGIPFTVIKGEMDGAIKGNEDLDEVNQHNYTVTSEVKQVFNRARTALTSKYEPEIYIDDKLFIHSRLAALDISEDFIPTMFTRSDLISQTSTRDWINIAPFRYKIHTGTFFNNSFFCNGLQTTPSSGLRSNICLQKAINHGLLKIAAKDFYNFKLLHNYTSLFAGDLYSLFDLQQAILGDYLSNIIINHNIDDNVTNPIPDITNPTQVSVIALLHHFMDEDLPLLIAGHSQGALITANAIMTFSTFGTAHRDFLKDKVKVLHLEPEILISGRNNLRSLVKEYLVYIMNASDEEGTDLLIEAAGGDFPLIPGQTPGLITNSDTIANLQDLFSNPDFLNFEYYKDIVDTIINSGNVDISRLINYFSTVRMEAHFIPVQLKIINNDIINGNFRTDPGVLTNRSIQLSTAAALDTTSINVQTFFTA